VCEECVKRCEEYDLWECVKRGVMRSVLRLCEEV
jgi:hypothetical protein